MMPRFVVRSSARGRAAGVLTLGIAVALAGCTAAGPPKPPPPPLQESARPDATNPVGVPTAVGARPPAPSTVGAPVAAPPSAPAAPPTLPPVIAEAITAAPPPTAESTDSDLPTAKELAAGMIAALANARTAQLSARLPSGHTTDLIFVAPDRASLVEQDTDGAEYARYVIIGDTGYTNQVSSGAGWRKVVNEGFRKQTQIFRPMQVALATGNARTLDSGGEVELLDVGGKPALRAVFEYGSSPELEELGLMRSGANILEVVVDPSTWLPIRTREETQGAITEVTFVDFNQSARVEAPIS